MHMHMFWSLHRRRWTYTQYSLHILRLILPHAHTKRWCGLLLRKGLLHNKAFGDNRVSKFSFPIIFSPLKIYL